mmetsp:Transcript_7166/g.18350  ORF Transcript_7166/g.18350 Transcript_7166/m.18350 type:complete len:639 (+) Transcript_7166:2341-4257(+)
MLRGNVLVAVAEDRVGHADALSSAVAVAAHVEREAAPLDGEHVLRGVRNVDRGVKDLVNASSQSSGQVRLNRLLVLCCSDCVHRRAEGRQTSRAGGIAVERWAPQPKGVRQARADRRQQLRRVPVNVRLAQQLLRIHPPHEQLIGPLRSTVADEHTNGRVLALLLGHTRAGQALVTNLENLPLVGDYDAGLVIADAEELVVEGHDNFISAKPTVGLVAVLVGHVIVLPILGKVQIRVEAGERHPDAAVHARAVHLHGGAFAGDSSAGPAGHSEDARALMVGRRRSGDKAKELVLEPRVPIDCVHLDAGRVRKGPGLERHVVAIRVQAEAHEVTAEHQHLAFAQGHLHRLHRDVLPRMEGDGAAGVVHEVHEAQLPALEEVQVPPHLAILDVLLAQLLRLHHALLPSARVGHPDHGVREAVGAEAHGVGGHGPHAREEVPDVCTVLHQRVARHALLEPIRDGRHAGRVQWVDLRHLAGALPAEVVGQELLAWRHVVQALGLRHRLLPRGLALAHLEQAVVLGAEQARDLQAEVEEGLRIGRHGKVEAAVLGPRDHVLPQVLSRNVDEEAVKCCDRVLPLLLALVDHLPEGAVDVHGPGALQEVRIFRRHGPRQPVDLRDVELEGAHRGERLSNLSALAA